MSTDTSFYKHDQSEENTIMKESNLAHYFGTPDQIGIVSSDVRKSITTYADLLGIEPWTVYRFEPPKLKDTTYYGDEREYGMLLAVAHMDDLIFEVIEPLFGPNIYDDFLNAGNEGIHHYGYFSHPGGETQRIVAALEQHGYPMVQSGEFLGTEYWYFDTTDDLEGLYLEVGNSRNVEAREIAYRYPE